jgi:hypothetical protein
MQAFDRVFKEEDRTGEDYDGRVDAHDYSILPLFSRQILSVSQRRPMLLLNQMAINADRETVLVHYYS